ncbi:hypothetical protein BB31_12575 [Amycolatopsis lurida NRRL 2430]|uniref:SGNH hydrolase-type esterase domain-containing protein n=2 Tax=Amycolatopsis lurida TaxID=31959 RepID=A0A2P2FVN9_AMYLU|nr:hypothetical protein BB31_12575 [Amycolatopsis lurida NRRL 2430]
MPLVESPTGSITLACTTLDNGQDLVTYDDTGQQIRRIDRTSIIDGVPNCINDPVVDKNDDLYGIPSGVVNGYWAAGPNLLAYDGNTLKWKYPVHCGNDQGNDVVVGADGNIYATVYNNGVHLIGLTPEVEPGTTQPKKILDIVIPNDCSIRLHPYKDGIMVHGQSSGKPRYYSYGGKFLGEATIDDIWYEKLNADGQLFVGKYVSGSYRSARVDMYDPRTGKVRTTPASTPGANVNGVQVYPLQGGGVAALVNEQKMISSGVPATPEEYINTLVTINSAGVVTEAIHLTNTYSQNGVTGTFGGTFVSAESNGKIAVIRELNLNTGISWPPTVPAIVIGAYSPASETWSYQAVMQGDLGKSGGPSGYYFNYNHFAHAMAVSNDTVSFIAKCSNNCTNYSPKLYAVKVTGLGTSYPRGDVLSANTGTQPAPRSLMALGDSFSAGEGIEPFMDGNVCHRSTQAYSRVLGTDPYTTLQLDKFVACSGAKTTHVLNGWYDTGRNESPQISALTSGSPKIVTLTIGGNDILFADFAKACILDTCNFSSGVYNNSLNAINNTLGGSLTSTYKKLLEVTQTSGAKIYVLGYPQVIADKSVNEIGDARCPYMYESVPVAAGRYWEDARAARDIVTKLNTKITDTVDAVRALSTDNQRLVFVSATGTSSPFDGHEVCSSGESYFHNFDQALNNTAYVFHPNVKGQAAYAQLVRQAIGE